MGFQNAHYWGDRFARTAAAAASASVDDFPHERLREAIQGLSNGHDMYSRSPSIRRWMRTHGLDRTDRASYDPRAVHALCATVLRQKDRRDGNEHDGSDDIILQQFAEEVATAELRIVLQHTLTKAGYEIPSDLYHR